MTDAWEIIATKLPFADAIKQQWAQEIIDALHAADFRILGPDEVDQVTLEKAAALIEANGIRHSAAGYSLAPRFEGDTHGLAYAAAIRALGRKA